MSMVRSRLSSGEVRFILIDNTHHGAIISLLEIVSATNRHRRSEPPA